jgi:hypothetical protein
VYEGIPVVDARIHAARRTTPKVSRPLWALGVRDASESDELYDKKAVFGTDWPGVPGFRHDTLERVLWRNANDVYRLGL